MGWATHTPAWEQDPQSSAQPRPLRTMSKHQRNEFHHLACQQVRIVSVRIPDISKSESSWSQSYVLTGHLLDRNQRCISQGLNASTSASLALASPLTDCQHRMSQHVTCQNQNQLDTSNFTSLLRTSECHQCHNISIACLSICLRGMPAL